MYVLYAEDQETLRNKAKLFDIWMEPLLERLEEFYRKDSLCVDIPEIPEYLQVCRYPFRRLEYSFVLETLLESVRPGDKYLDAGSGATPLAFVMANRGVDAHACDGNERLIDSLQSIPLHRIFGAKVEYSTQNLTSTSYPDAEFDAISCVSVLEHIPSPEDKSAIREVLRILKPGGTFVCTVDFSPAGEEIPLYQFSFYLKRTINLLKSGGFSGLFSGIRRKVKAQQVVSQGMAKNARSANQCFSINHLEEDIHPCLEGEELPSNLSFSQDLKYFKPIHARRFWQLEGKSTANFDRDVLPVGFILRKK